ncbi:NAD(P)-dependent oxidoreductase [Streptomyces sp. SID13666]|nr:NAD(P)-dependent oxidoreductase [Streptomyces sp. SID13666]NEA72826.1 NAD(P)-dependent oxidoreductase [Streptomyces sp. SID13588]
MGAAVAAEATGAATVLWCSQGRSKETSGRAAQRGLTPIASLSALTERCDIILSICPPANAHEVAAEVAELGYSGIYVDANAISPRSAETIGALVERGGAVFVDGSVVGSPPSPAKVARLYLAGPKGAVTETARLFLGTQVDPRVLSGDTGSASALKLAYSSYQKASRALAAVAHALAADHGVEGELLDIAQSHPTSYLSDPDYFPKVAARAWRWAPEMREVVEALAANGLPTDLAGGAAKVLDRWEDAKGQSLTVLEALERLRFQGAP